MSSWLSGFRGTLARHGVFVRVFLAISASLLVAIALSGALFWFVLSEVWEDIGERDLGDVQALVERAVQTNSLRNLQTRFQRDEGVGLVVLRGRRPVGLPPPRWMMQQLDGPAGAGREGLSRILQRNVHASFSLNGERYSIVLMPNIRSVWQFARPVGWILTLCALVLASAWVAWMLTRPLRVLSANTRRLAEGDLQARVPDSLATRKDALGQLGSEFNAMAGRLEALLASQQQLLRDVSHELRTPLARLQVALTMAQDEPSKAPDMLQRGELELERLDKLIGQVLSLSRLQSGAELLEAEPLDLVELLRDVSENAEFEFADRGIRVRLSAEPVELLGDRHKLSSALENILRNAMRYSPDNGEIQIDVVRDQERVAVSVSDRGPGVEEAVLPRLFEAFYRADSSRGSQTGGHGVGLAIAREAVFCHRGTIEAHNREGGGLVVTVSLPVLQQ